MLRDFGISWVFLLILFTYMKQHKTTLRQKQNKQRKKKGEEFQTGQKYRVETVNIKSVNGA